MYLCLDSKCMCFSAAVTRHCLSLSDCLITTIIQSCNAEPGDAACGSLCRGLDRAAAGPPGIRAFGQADRSGSPEPPLLQEAPWKAVAMTSQRCPRLTQTNTDRNLLGFSGLQQGNNKLEGSVWISLNITGQGAVAIVKSSEEAWCVVASCICVV